MVQVKEDLTGRTFGRLTVICQAEDYVNNKGKHSAQWLCQCSCGNSPVVVKQDRLKGGITKSCGCLIRETASKTKKKYNSYNLNGEYGIGYTEKGEEFYFDLEDYDKIKKYYWRKNCNGYMISQIYDKETKSNKNIWMHRLVTNCPDELWPDHIHGNKSRNDNRKSNLRIADWSQNNQNKGIRSHNTSGVTGVNFHKASGKWIARINVNKREIYLGCYDNFDDAAAARKKAEGVYFGEFSYENSIHQGVDLFDHYRNDSEAP